MLLITIVSHDGVIFINLFLFFEGFIVLDEVPRLNLDSGEDHEYSNSDYSDHVEKRAARHFYLGKEE